MPKSAAPSKQSQLELQQREIAEALVSVVEQFNEALDVLQRRLHALEANAFGSARHEQDLISSQETGHAA
jgi:hypothetical protein